MKYLISFKKIIMCSWMEECSAVQTLVALTEDMGLIICVHMVVQHHPVTSVPRYLMPSSDAIGTMHDRDAHI